MFSRRIAFIAAIAGLPVVASDWNGYRQTVVNDETGYLVTGDDELFARLRQLIASPAQRVAMGRAGRAHAEKFDWDPITRQWENIFLRLAPRKS